MSEAVKLLKQIVEAYDTGNVEMNSPEIGGQDDILPHPWHEEWLYHARVAIADQEERARA